MDWTFEYRPLEEDIQVVDDRWGMLIYSDQYPQLSDPVQSG